MKKVILVMIGIMSMITLASCGGKPDVDVVSVTIEEMKVPENIIEETVIEETMIYTYVELEGKSFTDVKMTKSEMDELMDAYSDGLVSKEYAWELLYNSQS